MHFKRLFVFYSFLLCTLITGPPLIPVLITVTGLSCINIIIIIIIIIIINYYHYYHLLCNYYYYYPLHIKPGVILLVASDKKPEMSTHCADYADGLRCMPFPFKLSFPYWYACTRSCTWVQFNSFGCFLLFALAVNGQTCLLNQHHWFSIQT